MIATLRIPNMCQVARMTPTSVLLVIQRSVQSPISKPSVMFHLLKVNQTKCYNTAMHIEISFPSYHLPKPISTATCTRGHSQRLKQMLVLANISFIYASLQQALFWRVIVSMHYLNVSSDSPISLTSFMMGIEFNRLSNVTRNDLRISLSTETLPLLGSISVNVIRPFAYA